MIEKLKSYNKFRFIIHFILATEKEKLKQIGEDQFEYKTFFSLEIIIITKEYEKTITIIN